MAIDKNLPPATSPPTQPASETVRVKSKEIDEGGVRAYGLLLMAAGGSAEAGEARKGLKAMIDKLPDESTVSMLLLAVASLKNFDPSRRDLDTLPQTADAIKTYLTAFLSQSEDRERAVARAGSTFE